MKEEDSNLIENISNNYKLRFKDLNIKQYDNFKFMPKMEIKQIRSWYRNRYRGFVKPKINH